MDAWVFWLVPVHAPQVTVREKGQTTGAFIEVGREIYCSIKSSLNTPCLLCITYEHI